LSIFKTISFILRHPFNKNDKFSALLRFIKWQINVRLNPYPVLYPFTENTTLLIKKGMTGATGNLYCGLVEYEDMSFLLHLLRESDLFLDVGANIGAYTILASGETGARTFAFEPIPDTFNILNTNVFINQIENKVKIFNIGIGKEKGKIKFTASLDTINHVAFDASGKQIEVDVDTLDNMLTDMPILVKIDVEGYETEVIKGANKLLANTTLKAIIIELNGSGLNYGYSDKEIHEMILSYGFKPHAYNPALRSLSELESFGQYNTLYLRDIPFINERVKTARKVRVGQKAI